METNGWHDNTHSLFALQAAMRRTFQRTQEFCDEAQKYMDLVAQEEADARRPGTAGLEIGIGWWLFVWLVVGMFDFTFPWSRCVLIVREADQKRKRAERC